MTLQEYVEVFKALSDETRLRMIHLFVISGEELCVCELTDTLEVPQYNVSRHLKALVQAGLLRREKEGRWVYFKLSTIEDPVIQGILEAIGKLPKEIIQRDALELHSRLKLRTNGRCTIGIQKKHLLGTGRAR